MNDQTSKYGRGVADTNYDNHYNAYPRQMAEESSTPYGGVQREKRENGYMTEVLQQILAQQKEHQKEMKEMKEELLRMKNTAMSEK